MKYSEIAKFLNVPEKIVKMLAKKGVLPGRAKGDCWGTTLSEIEHWYNQHSGKDWAELVANGRVDPLAAQEVLKGKVSLGILLNVLNTWEQKGTLKIISQNSEHQDNPKIVVTLNEAIEEGLKGIESLEQSNIIETVRSQIEIVYRCEEVIGRNPVMITLSKEGILKLTVESPLAELPQRDREIIRFLLAKYTHQLSVALQQEQS